MKIHVVSAALLLVMSGAAHAVNVYQGDTSDLSIFGRLEGGFYNKYANQTRENHVRNKAGINGEARLGVKATSEIVTNIKGVAFGEWEVSSASSEDNHFSTRYAYTGFDLCQYGTLVFGQGDTAKYLTTGMTDVFEHYGNTANDYWLLGGRQEGQIMYLNAVGGYSFGFSYQTARNGMGSYFNHETGIYQDLDVNGGYAASMAYNWNDGLLESAAFSLSYDFYDMHKSEIGDKHSFSAGISYGHLNSGLYTSLVYSRDKFQYESHHRSGYEGVAGYTMDNGLGVMLGYSYYGYDNHHTDKSEITSQLSWHFTPAIMLYAEGRFGLGRLDYPVKETRQHNAYMINMQYNF